MLVAIISFYIGTAILFIEMYGKVGAGLVSFHGGLRDRRMLRLLVAAMVHV